jgi:hypothetical protein
LSTIEIIIYFLLILLLEYNSMSAIFAAYTALKYPTNLLLIRAPIEWSNIFESTNIRRFKLDSNLYI